MTEENEKLRFKIDDDAKKAQIARNDIEAIFSTKQHDLEVKSQALEDREKQLDKRDAELAEMRFKLAS